MKLVYNLVQGVFKGEKEWVYPWAKSVKSSVLHYGIKSV